jgi:hypothetical protein
MQLNFNLASFEAIKRPQNRVQFNEAEEARILNEVIKNKQAISVRSYFCGVNNHEYFAIRSKGCKRLSVIASKHNATMLMQYATTGAIQEPIKPLLEEDEDKGDDKAMLAIAETLLKNHQTIQMVPQYKTDGHIKGTWFSRYVNFDFYFKETENVKRLFEEYGQAI